MSQNIHSYINAWVLIPKLLSRSRQISLRIQWAGRQLITGVKSDTWWANIPTLIWTNLPIFPARALWCVSLSRIILLFNQPLAFWCRIFRVRVVMSVLQTPYMCVHLQTRALIWFTLCVAHRQTSPSAPSRSAKWRASWCWSAMRPPTPRTSTSRGRSKTKMRLSRRMWRPRASSAFSPSSRGAKTSAPTSASPTTRLACPSRVKETSQVSLHLIYSLSLKLHHDTLTNRSKFLLGFRRPISFLF